MEEHFQDDNGNTAVIALSEKGYSLTVTHFLGTVWRIQKPYKTYWQAKKLLKV